jgi:hypothetical protein
MTLRREELDAFLEGNFWLDCPRLLLRPSTSGEESYEGAGFIRQQGDDLTFVLYAASRVGNADHLMTFANSTGKRFSWDLPQYDLLARDTRGRQWTSEVRLFDTSEVFDEPGVVCRGRLQVIRQSEPRAVANDNIYMFVVDHLPLPINVTSLSEVRSGSELVEQRLVADTWRFACGDKTFVIRKVREAPPLTEVRIESVTGGLPAGLDTRVEEALRFVCARYLSWAVLVENRGSRTITSLHSRNRAAVTRHDEVVPRYSDGAPERAAAVFCAYLRHIERFDEPRYHPLSVTFGQILLASSVNIEAEALALGPAVEAIVKRSFPQLMEEGTDVVTAVEELVAAVESMQLREGLKPRATQALRRLKTKSVQAALQCLVDDKTITAEHLAAWRAIRHATAHGEDPSGGVEVVVKHCDVVYELLVLLVLRTIGVVEQN